MDSFRQRKTFVQAATVAVLLFGATAALAEGPSPGRVPLLVELFTSEGCSSCPPADATLARLLRTQPVPGVEVIALGEHVDYWDSLGWRDPFSSAESTRRQERYSAQLGTGRIYTPQAVVGGQLDVLGSDEAGLVRALTRLRSQVQGTLILVGGSGGANGALSVKLDASHLPEQGAADVLLAVVEDDLASKVERGENRGRTLQHAAVVRKLDRVGEISGAAWLGEARVTLDPAWRADSLRLVAFIQDRRTGRVLAAGSTRALGARATGPKE